MSTATYQQIIDLVQDCVRRMQDAGESHRMLARWISEGIDALSAAQAQPGVVKPLEWELINGWWFGPTAEGQNYIVRASSATNFKGQWLWGLGVDKYELAPSLEAAKAAAMKDYSSRILSALETSDEK